MSCPPSSPADFESRFLARWPANGWRDTRLVIACSGGTDSTALLRFLVSQQPLRERLIVAHYHHGVRGAAADADADFVQHLANQWELTYEVGRARSDDWATLVGGEGWESAARRLRYQFLQKIAHQYGARYLAVGHNADDQLETILHHLLRGSSWRGWAGMPSARQLDQSLTLIRPLLSWTRAELGQYLQSLQQPVCQDEHNASDQFLRCRIRHELLPLLETRYHRGVRGALRRFAEQAQETQDYLQSTAARLLDAAVLERQSDRVALDTRLLAAQVPLIRREVFVELWRELAWPAQHMSRRHWQALSDRCVPDIAPPAIHLPGRVLVVRAEQQLVLQRQRPPDD